MHTRQFFEQAPFSVQIVDRNGRTLAVNRAWREIWQVSDEFVRDFILKEYNLLADPQLERLGHLPKIRAALAGETCEIPPFLYDPSEAGHEVPKRWLGATIFPLRDERGEVTSIALVHSDMTKEKVNEERLNDALDTGLMAWWELDLATNKVTRSSHHDRLYGFQQQLAEWNFDVFLSHLHPDDREPVQKEFGAMFSNGVDNYWGEFRVIWKDGSIHWLNSRAHFVRDKTGKPIALRGVLVDITPLKEAVRTRDDFLSVASHELKTPLTSLKLHTQIARRKQELGKLSPDAFVSTLDQLDRQVDRLAHLVDDMLDISRISRGKLSLNPEPVRLDELAQEVAERMGPQLAAANCALSVTAPQPVTAECDRFRIEQVLVNLMSNAARYAAGTPVEVRVDQPGSGQARISVSDRGPGISTGDQERVFALFERGSSHAGGLGLGLFIVREIVQMHGGTVELESSPGNGATFRFSLKTSR